MIFSVKNFHFLKLIQIFHSLFVALTESFSTNTTKSISCLSLPLAIFSYPFCEHKKLLLNAQPTQTEFFHFSEGFHYLKFLYFSIVGWNSTDIFTARLDWHLSKMRSYLCSSRKASGQGKDVGFSHTNRRFSIFFFRSPLITKIYLPFGWIFFSLNFSNRTWALSMLEKFSLFIFLFFMWIYYDFLLIDTRGSRTILNQRIYVFASRRLFEFWR